MWTPLPDGVVVTAAQPLQQALCLVRLRRCRLLTLVVVPVLHGYVAWPRQARPAPAAHGTNAAEPLDMLTDLH